MLFRNCVLNLYAMRKTNQLMVSQMLRTIAILLAHLANKSLMENPAMVLTKRTTVGLVIPKKHQHAYYALENTLPSFIPNSNQRQTRRTLIKTFPSILLSQLQIIHLHF